MASKSFAINTEPHVAEVGDVKLSFFPEVQGAVFAAAYADLRAVQNKLKGSSGNKASSTKHAKDEDLDPKILGEVSAAMESFVAGFLLPASKEEFEGMRLPDRILLQLIEWIAEIYGGGSGNPEGDGGQSSD